MDHLVVENVTGSGHDFLTDVKLRSGNRVFATITCSTMNEVSPGDIEDVTCVPDGSGKGAYNEITISNTY